MPSRKYTLRLPGSLEATVQAHLAATGACFADLARAALHAYLSDTPPTGAGTQADSTADRLTTLEETLEVVTKRLEALEQRPIPDRQPADTSRQALPPREPTGADTLPHRYDPTSALARVQALQAAGCTLAEIAKTLNTEGVATWHGRRWVQSTVVHLLEQTG